MSAPDELGRNVYEVPENRGDLVSGVGEQVVDDLLDRADLAAPHELPGIIAEQAARIGAADAVLYLADLQQVTLLPFTGSVQPRLHQRLQPLSIDATMAGRAFQLGDLLTGREEQSSTGVQLWVPVLDGPERLGVLGARMCEQALVGPSGELLRLRLHRLAALAAKLIVAKGRYGDALVRARRQAQMGLAAEIQWGCCRR